MDIYNVHTREIGAPAHRSGECIDSIGSETDRTWPAGDRWPPSYRIRFDQPLGVGAVGGHDNIPYSVEAYEPGRRVVFRFDERCGLTGTHSLHVEDIGTDRCRVVHTLDCDTRGSMRWLRPVLIRFHDAYVEDILDAIERSATGSVLSQYRQARWLRAWNRLDAWRQTRRTRDPGAATAARS